MRTSKPFLRPIFWSLLVLLAVSGSLRGLAAETGDLTYPDKLFGGDYTFTLNPNEVMVRLAAEPGVRATRRDAARLAASQGLTIVHDEGITNHGFVVYHTSGKATAAVVAALATDPAVARAFPALLNADGSTRYFLPDQAVVQFDPVLSEDRMRELIVRLGSEVVIDHWTPGFYTVTVPTDRDVFDQIRAFNDLAEVQFAELSTISFNDAAFVPNDPLYANQWAVKNTGTGFYTNDADGDVEEAWDIERGNPDVIVAVIDTGVDWGHPDLQPNILQNLGEDFDNDSQTMIWDGTAWTQDPDDINGIDDDGNGQVDDLFGWDFANDDPDPAPSSCFDCAHGTACAGLVAAVGHNSEGIAGVAHGCRIMPLRVDLTSGVNQNRADAINYAVGEAGDHAAMVLSCSWICSSGSTIAVQNAVVNARNNGVLPVFAAGNSNGAVSFPANLGAAMAIAATSPCDERKSPSSCDGATNWGSNFGNPLSLGAPGVLMQTTDITDGTGFASGDYTATFAGTSSACPVTAGAVALLHSEAIELTGNPLTPEDAERLLEETAEEVGGYAYPGGFSQELGNGRINVNLALQLLVAENLAALLPPPVDVALSIDRSGSMMWDDSILAAENAAAQVVRLLDIGDEIAVTSYSGGPDQGTTPDWPAWTDFPMTEITTETVKDAAIATIKTGGDVYYYTAIGAGMQWARNELYGVEKADYPQAIILLSDGNNTDGPDPLTILPLTAPQPNVYTIGFGDLADEVTLQAIAAATGGSYYFAGTSGSKTRSSPLSLIQTYQLALMNATERENLAWINGQMRVPGEEGYEFVMDDSVDQALIALLWGFLDPEAFELILTDPAGVSYDTSSPEWVGDATTCAYRINQPEPGNWVAVVRSFGSVDGHGYYHVNLAGSSRVRSHLDLIPDGFGQPIFARLYLDELIRDVGLTPVLDAEVNGTVTYPNNESEPLSLNDLGQGGDETPDDGIYSGIIQNTSANGAFTVETIALGHTSQGYPFSRYDLATAVIDSEQEQEPLAIQLPHALGMPGTLLNLPILATPQVNAMDIAYLELGFAFDPDVVDYVSLGELNGSMMAGWYVEVEDQGDIVILRGEGEPLQGEGLLAQILFEVTGPLGANTPLAVVLLDLRDISGNAVAATGQDGEVVVGLGIPDHTPVPYPVYSGWRLRSLPVVLGTDERVQDQLHDVGELLLWANDEYVPTDNPGAGQGMWMLYGGPDGEEVLVGDPLGYSMQILPAGWSLVGGLFDQPAEPRVAPEGLDFAMLGQDPELGYRPATQIEPGMGVWFHAAVPFTLTVVAAEIESAGQDPGFDKVFASASLMAIGNSVAGTPSINHVVIGGGDENPGQVPYPPAPPEYTTLLRLLDTGDPSVALYSDTRAGAEGEFWFLDLQPGGNLNGSGTVLSWNSDDLRAITDVDWILYEGLGFDGPVLIEDMREGGAFTVAGAEPRQFTVSASGLAAVDNDDVPTAYALAGNHPNPFNPMTTIRYDVPRAGHIRIDVFDVRGKRVATLVDRVVQPGHHSVVWDGRDRHGASVSSGVYFSQLTADGVKFIDRMTLLK